jgi:putative ubiquitin-RnfH superfamily antitoxin RatB of RatAB toxin-antitoxin module
MADSPAAVARMRVQVCHVAPARQIVREIEVEPGATMFAAIRASGILAIATEIDLSTCGTGIHGKLRGLDTVLRDGDRIEIYRPLIVDPMVARRRRAGKRAP